MNHLAWTRFGAALEWYRHLGYEYVDVPWIVPSEFVEPTLPLGKSPWVVQEGLNTRGSLVGSAEQAFWQLLSHNILARDRRYMAITPCFRAEEQYSEIIRPWFMKLELLAPRDAPVAEIADHAHRFFRRWYPGALVIRTEEGLDITYNGVELGSYGSRRDEYVYGTGLAEPRFTLAGKK